MAWAKFENNQIIEYASIAPPQTEEGVEPGWSEIAEDDPRVVAFLNPAPASFPNWEQLENDFRGTEVWQKVFMASTQSLPANSAFTLLYGTLTTTHNLADLRLAITLTRQGMKATPIGDFNADELKWITDTLTKNNFNPSEFDLKPATT